MGSSPLGYSLLKNELGTLQDICLYLQIWPRVSNPKITYNSVLIGHLVLQSMSFRDGIQHPAGMQDLEKNGRLLATHSFTNYTVRLGIVAAFCTFLLAGLPFGFSSIRFDDSSDEAMFKKKRNLIF